ncbi:LPXTG cell wall anchor domain-containing protein [Actinomyces sp. ICM47]|uniref:LPXTG cell wall anchor domain-containing protein n=1 Tax=Actinomyces sp. ICM47 TaxID=936548 RepID=UPI0025C47031|nr:LPXTG cell wall anchor domain-containing protein [Actinomyces sp. ICM47]
MKKTTASLFAVTAAFGIIAASTGIAVAAESPIGDSAKGNPSIGEPSKGNPSIGQPTPSPSTPVVGPEEPSNPGPGPEQPSTPAPEPQTPTPSEEPSVPEPVAPGSGTGVTTHGEVTPAEGPAPVSVRSGIRRSNEPAEASTTMLANTGSSASIAAGTGAIALAGGVTLIIARKRH